MNLIKSLTHLGFKPEDYIIVNSDFSMVQKTEQRRIYPIELDEEGIVRTELIDITPPNPSIEQLESAWEEVQLKEYDITLLINEYLIGKEHDAENDSLNIVNGLLHSFNFTHIQKPTNTELLALKDIVANKKTNSIKYKQITDLESQITVRRLREAFLTNDLSFIQNIEDQIEAIRATL